MATHRSGRLIRNFGLGHILAFFAMAIFFSIIDIYSYFSKNYYAKQADLVKLDTFHLKERAWLSSGKSGGGRLWFQSTNSYVFVFAEGRYNAIDSVKQLNDSLIYHDTKFIAYTNNQGATDFFANKSKRVELYQLSTGEKNYINIDKANDKAAKILINKMLLWIVFYIAPLSLLYTQRKSWNNLIKEIFAKNKKQAVA